MKQVVPQKILSYVQCLIQNYMLTVIFMYSTLV